MLVGLGPPGILGNLLAAGSHCWVLTKESCTQVYALERKASLASSVDKELGGTLGAGKLGCCTAGTPFSSQSLQKSCESEPRVSGSQSLLEEDVPEPLSHVQASSSRGTEPLSSLDLSHGSLVASEYVPFFRTYGKLLAVEDPAPPHMVGRDQGRDQNIREVPFPEDPEPPSGFFPHYRSKEESFPSLVLPGRSCGGSRDTRTRKEALAGCFCRMAVSCRCSVSVGVWGGEQPRAPWHSSDLRPGTPPSKLGQYHSRGLLGLPEQCVQRLEAEPFA